MQNDSGGRGKVLVVEDPFVARYIGTLLARHGYDAIPVGIAQAGRILGSEDGAACVVLTNIPREFLAFSGRIPLLYLAAAPDPELAARFQSCRMVRKPFHAGELIEALDELEAAAVA